MEIKNLKKAAQRILRAIKDKEKIILYGDSDLDGVSSVIILKESIRNLGGHAEAIYFPDRDKEGYGLTKKALESLKDFVPALLVMADCGIGNFEELSLAKKIGLEAVVIDHHEVLGKLPIASIIVDPKQKTDKYPFKLFAATGIVYKLSKEMFGNKMPESLEKSFLELVALATIADMMPLEDENRLMTTEGLSLLKNSFRPGVQVFFKQEYFKSLNDLNEKVSKIISLLNVRDIKEGFPASYRLLTMHSVEEAEILVEDLIKKNFERKQKIGNAILDLEEKIKKQTEEAIIFEGNEEWETTYLSAVASVISHKFQKPTFLFKKNVQESQGTTRLPKGLDGVQAMMSCSSLLMAFGGHPQAGGFKIKTKNLENFKECLIKFFKN